MEQDNYIYSNTREIIGACVKCAYTRVYRVKIELVLRGLFQNADNPLPDKGLSREQAMEQCNTGG